MGAPHVRIKRY